MSLALDFICPLPNGVHARPAGALAKAARGFKSEVTLTNSRTGQSANSKSVLAVVSAGIRHSDACRLSVNGSDEAEAMTVLSRFLSNDLPRCDHWLPSSPARTGNGRAFRPAASRRSRSTVSLAHALFDPALIVMAAESTTKTEAMNQAVALLAVSGRTGRPAEIAQSLWQREAVSSTGFGHGIAIPHCKSSAVRADSVVILKLRTPVDWGSIDHQPVHLIMLMVVRDTAHAGGHMRILSQLARKLMDGNFRERIARETDRAALCGFLKENVNM